LSLGSWLPKQFPTWRTLVFFIHHCCVSGLILTGSIKQLLDKPELCWNCPSMLILAGLLMEGLWLVLSTLPFPWLKELMMESPSARALHNILNLKQFSEAEPNWMYLTDGAHSENLGFIALLHLRWHHKHYTSPIVLVDGTQDADLLAIDFFKAVQVARTKFKFSFSHPNGTGDFEADFLDFLKQESTHTFYFLVQVDRSDRSSRIPCYYGRARSPQNERVIEGCCCECCHSGSSLLSCCYNLCGSFPHHSTALQCFTPSLFNAYRKQGNMIACQVLTNMMLNTSRSHSLTGSFDPDEESIVS